MNDRSTDQEYTLAPDDFQEISGPAGSVHPESYVAREYELDSFHQPAKLKSDFTGLQAAMASLGKFIEEGAKLTDELKISQLPAILEYLEKFPSTINQVVAAINGLPEPDTSRDIEVGKAMLPFALRAWKRTPPSGTASDFFNLYKSFNAHGPEDGFKMNIPDWLKGAMIVSNAKQIGDDFPDKSEYFQHSERLSKTFAAINHEIAELHAKYLEVEAYNNKSLEMRGKPSHDVQMAALEVKISEAKAKFDPLFDKLLTEVRDVDPLELSSALNQIHVKVNANANALNGLLKGYQALEKITVALAFASSPSRSSKVAVTLPVFSGTSLTAKKLECSTEDFSKALESNPELLANSIRALTHYRTELLSLMDSFAHFSDYKKEALPAFKEKLALPFSSHGEAGSKILTILLNSEDIEVKRQLAELLKVPAFYSKTNDSWIYPIEMLEQHALYRWAVENYMSSDDKQRPIFESLISTSPLVNDAISGILREAQKFVKSKDMEGLAIFIQEQIEAQKKEPSLPRILGFVSLCSYFSKNEQTSKALKLKIPNIPDLKDLTSLINRENRELKATYGTISAAVGRSLSNSLDDFYLGKDKKKVEECLDNFQLVTQDLSALDGIDGTKIRQGMAIVGEPGVGKTHLVELIAQQLGLKCFLISPWEKRKDETMTDMVNRKYEEAKEHAKSNPCMMFFDEAEAIMPERDNPRATPEMQDRTDHILQIIDDARKKHPNILPVVVTNFEHKLDEAVVRRGRIDFKIRRQKPDAELRRKIISDTLDQEGIESLTDKQIDQLADMTDGLLVLPLMTPIIESNRVYSRLNGSSDVDFESLKVLYEEALEDLQEDQKRRQEKAKYYGQISSQDQSSS